MEKKRRDQIAVLVGDTLNPDELVKEGIDIYLKGLSKMLGLSAVELASYAQMLLFELFYSKRSADISRVSLEVHSFPDEGDRVSAEELRQRAIDHLI